MSDAINLRTLEAFYWVARLGGFGRAAEKLHTTQPAVSARIAQMEAAFDVRLLERDRRRRVTLTPKGIEMLAQAERMLALRGEMVALLSSPTQLGGTVRLGVSESIVHLWLAELVQRLHAEHPRITLDISVDVSQRLRDGVLAGEMDVGIVLGPVAAPQVVNLPLGEVALAWVASPNLPMRDGPLDLAALAAWPILTYARATRPYRQVADLFATTAGTRLFANSSLSSIVRMAVDGIGIGAIPPAVIGRELADGSLVLLDALPRLDPLVYEAVYLDGPGNTLAAAVARMTHAIA